MTRIGLRRLALISLLVGSGGAAPSFAADAAATGIVAGLGITAASGRSSVSSGGGAIEASLLSTDMMLTAGLGIRKLVQKQVPADATVILLGHSDTLDLSMARWLPKRIVDVRKQFDTAVKDPKGCPAPALRSSAVGLVETLPTFAPTDIATAIMTDTSISGITMSADDRQLVNAVEMSGNGDGAWHDVSAVNLAARAPAAHFVVVGERIDANPEEAPITDLAELQKLANGQRHCTSAEFKAAVSMVDSFVSSVTAADKGTPAILAAAELAPYVRPGARPYVLRLAIEAIGGTSIARSNIWYAVGFPGAVMISSGVLVSFRLFDAQTGEDRLVGKMRCALRPTNLTKVHNLMIAPAPSPEKAEHPEVNCGYRLG